MKNSLVILLVIGISVLFTACPYSSEVALDERPNIEINNVLIGTWELRSGDDYAYIITAKDAYQYTIIKRSKTPGTDDVVYTAFFSKIGDHMFLNISDNASDVPVYYFYKFTDNGNGRITLEAVTENIDETFTNASEMRNYFKTHAGTSFFYEKEAEEYLKIK